MRLSHIQHVLDSIDPYFFAKDFNLELLDSDTIDDLENATNKSKHQKLLIKEFKEFLNVNASDDVKSDFLACKVLGNYIRILPFGYINADFKKALYSQPNPFIAGSIIDFLAFYMDGDYDKAFKLFFQQYSSMIKDKLSQEPAFIEKVIKGSYIKRHNVLNYIVNKLYEPKNTNLILCEQWAVSRQIEHIEGYAYFDTSQNILNMFNYFETGLRDDKISNKNSEEDKSSEYSDFINNHLIKDCNEWVVIPYFSDYHEVGALKFINPKDNTYYFLKLNDCKFSYAGLFSLNPAINFVNDKVRILEDDATALALMSYAKKMMNQDKLFYMSVNMDNAGLTRKSNISMLSKPMFLHSKNSSLVVMKGIYDTLLNKNSLTSDLYICEYNNFKEDNTAYTFEAFLEKQFKKLVRETCLNEFGQASLSRDLIYFINCCDFNNRRFRQKVVKWLVDSNYKGLYQQILELNEEMYEYRKYLIKTTVNGYIAIQKTSGISIKASDIAITNFIIKIDQVILFQEMDDIVYRARLIMGSDIEFPLIFCKKELMKGSAANALEQIALKAFYSCNFGDDLYFNTENYTLPAVFDPTFGNIIINLIKREMTKAPCSYGILYPGWDKNNGVFNAPSFQINAYRQVFKPQSIYALTLSSSKKSSNSLTKDIQYCYTNLPIEYTSYGVNLSFLNKEIRDLLSAILASLYRTYLGYNVKPFYIADTVSARNLVKFVFSVFGQIKPLELPANQRLLKDNGIAIFNELNRYPIYARCSGSADVIIDKIKDYPLFFFVKDTDIDNCGLGEIVFSINETKMNAETYKQVASFAQDTILRFFKWLFRVKTEQLELTNQDCASQDQLIEEGNVIFSYLWWDDVVAECDKSLTPESALKTMITAMTFDELTKHINYYPEKQCYVLKRFWLSENARKATIAAYKIMKIDGKAWRDPSDKMYIFIDKEFFEETTRNVLTKDVKPVMISRIFVSPALAITKNKYGSYERTMHKQEFIRRANNNAPGYNVEALNLTI